MCVDFFFLYFQNTALKSHYSSFSVLLFYFFFPTEKQKCSLYKDLIFELFI